MCIHMYSNMYIYMYVCIHIYIYTSAPTRLERGNANLFRCADLEKRADFNLRRVRQLEKITDFQSVRTGKIVLTWTWVFCVRLWKSALTWTWLLISRISTRSHEGGFGQIVARVVLCALLLAGLFRTILVGVVVDHGSHLYIQHVLHTKPSRQTNLQYTEKGTQRLRHTQTGERSKKKYVHRQGNGVTKKSTCIALKIEAASNVSALRGISSSLSSCA